MARRLPSTLLHLLTSITTPIVGNAKFTETILEYAPITNNKDDAARVVAYFLDNTGTLTTFQSTARLLMQ
jgi:hypothetical protein